VKRETEPTSPNTGDITNTVIYTLLGISSLIAISTIIVIKKKEK